MLAVGNLRSVWTVIPAELEGFQDLQNRFAQYFGRSWKDLMVGGERPYPYHRDWNAYLAVEGMRAYISLTTLPDLFKELHSKNMQIVQTIIG